MSVSLQFGKQHTHHLLFSNLTCVYLLLGLHPSFFCLFPRVSCLCLKWCYCRRYVLLLYFCYCRILCKLTVKHFIIMKGHIHGGNLYICVLPVKRLLLALFSFACQCGVWYCTYDNMRPQSGHVADYLIADSPASSCHYGNLAILSGHHWQKQKRTQRYQRECHLIRNLLTSSNKGRYFETWEVLIVEPVECLRNSDGLYLGF